jgi:hypothetical protein
MDKTIAIIQLLGWLGGAVLFGYLLVKSAESKLPSIITSVIKNITNYGRKKGNISKWGEDVINNRVSLNTHIKQGFKGWISITKMIHGRNKQSNTRSPEGCLDMLPENKTENLLNGLHKVNYNKGEIGETTTSKQNLIGGSLNEFFKFSRPTRMPKFTKCFYFFPSDCLFANVILLRNFFK